MKTNKHFLIISRSVLFRMRNFSDKSFRKNEETSCVQWLFFSKIVPFFEIIWKNFLESGRPQMTVWRMRIACWITTATNTNTEYVILIALPLQQWLHTRASMLRFTFIVSPVAYAFQIAVQQPAATRSWTISNIICSVPAVTNDVASTGIGEFISVHLSSTHLSSSSSYFPINVPLFWNSQI